MQKTHLVKIFNRIILIGLIGILNISCEQKEATNLSKSKFFTDSIFSKNLGEYRKHNVYLPQGYDEKKKYPILYATDGNKIKERDFYKITLDSLVNNKIIKPVILIISHNNNAIADSTSMILGNGNKVYLTFRNFEYINDYASVSKDSLLANRFKNHMLYFNNELIKNVENKFSQKLNKKDRYFYGVSNGAGFGLSLLNEHPNTIGTYICFSTSVGNIQSNIWKENVDYPNLYLEYGSDESISLKEDAEFLRSKYKELNLLAEINEYNGGHDDKIWNQKFIEIISKILTTE